MKLSLKTKTTALATVLAVVLLAAVGYLQHRRLGQDFQSVLLEQQDALAESVAENLADKLEMHLDLLERTAAFLDGALPADEEARQRFLREVALARRLFDRVAIFSADGKTGVFDEPVPNDRPLVISDRDYFKEVIATGRTVISPPILVRTGGGPAVLMVTPVRDAGGRIVAVLMGSLRLHRSNVIGELAQAPVGRTGHFEIVTVGASPVYVLHPDSSRLLSAVVPGPPSPGEIVTRKPLRVANWELRVVLPAWEAQAPVLAARRVLLWQLAVLAVAAAALAWLGVHWLLRPLSQLQVAIERLRVDPGAAVTLETSGADERGRLARAFESLMSQLRARQAELSAVTDASPLGFFRTDAEGSLTYVNEAYLRMHGLTRDAAAEGWHGLVDAAQREAVWREWRDAVGRAQEYVTVLPVTRPDGREALLSVRSAPLIADGRLLGHVGTVSDITERAEAEKALRVLATIFDLTTDYVVQTDPRGFITYMNPAARRLQALGADEPVRHRCFSEFHTPAATERFTQEIAPTVRAGGVWIGRSTIYGAHRREVPVSQMVIAHRDREGGVERYSAVMRDISSEMAAQREQERNVATLRSVTEALPAIVAVVGSDGRYRFVNGAFERWYGAPREAIVGSTVASFLGSEEYEYRRPWIERALAGEAVHFEREFPVVGGSRYLALNYVPLRLDDDRIDGFVAVAHDITQHRQEAVRLLGLAQRDALTGVLNRVGFEEYLECRIAAGEGAGLALLYIDLDHFKPVNDRHGHPVGDALLAMFAERLRGLVRPTDAVARLGGDEFAVVLSGLREAAHAQAVADKIVRAGGMPFDVGELRLTVGASIGVAVGVRPESGWRELVARADAMLYRAKEAGRGQYVGAVH